MPVRTLTGVNDLPMLATVDETAALLRTTRKAIYSDDRAWSTARGDADRPSYLDPHP
jgi:hypothetical protein